MDLGFNGDLATFAAVMAALTKFAIYPVVQLRRRVDSNNDGVLDDIARGTSYIHPDLQSVIALAAIIILAVCYSFASSQPLFPVLSAAATGLATARAAHEGIGAIKR